MANPEAPLAAALTFWTAHGTDTPFCWETKSLRVRVSVADHTRKGSRCLILEECGPPPATLTPEEAEVLYWVDGGKTNEEIAGILKIRISAVKAHLVPFSITRRRKPHRGCILLPRAGRWSRVRMSCRSLRQGEKGKRVFASALPKHKSLD